MCKMVTNLIERLTVVVVMCSCVCVESLSSGVSVNSLKSELNVTTQRLHDLRISNITEQDDKSSIHSREVENQRRSLEIHNER